MRTLFDGVCGKRPICDSFCFEENLETHCSQGQVSCASVPPPQGDDVAAASLRFHRSWPGSVPTEATVFKQFHVLAGFDYRACARRFVGREGPSSCAGLGPRRQKGPKARSAGSAGSGCAWPHRQLAAALA